MQRSTRLRFLLQPKYRRRAAIGLAGLSTVGLIGVILFFDTTYSQRSPASRKFVDMVLGISCQLVFWPSFVFLLMTFRSALKESKLLDLCQTCGYDLRASPERCPECGTAKAVSTDSGGKNIPI
ncbi:MAG TPA: hypothetical protein VGQ99_21120 [Tepidisphaeraceae bacterium]|jgi:hypothetical protein|nr:hypothetical protein [Tepidisphaeraceae bacterium]